MAEKYYNISPYAYCIGNPIRYVDPNGTSTFVVMNSDETYRVVGGDLEDDDKNIYLYSFKDGNPTKTSVGVTTSTTSFYNSDKKEWAKGSTIDPKDNSGSNFLKGIVSNSPTLVDYMFNARSNSKYDFKMTNGTDNPVKGIDIYRGMPLGKNNNGQTVYSSARDIGNITAGFIAGINGLSWIEARAGFDAYQSYQSNSLTTEGISTRNAEFYGWKMGALSPQLYKLYNITRSKVSTPLDAISNVYKLLSK